VPRARHKNRGGPCRPADDLRDATITHCHLMPSLVDEQFETGLVARSARNKERYGLS
jgi:hypothetical protein